MLRLNSTLNFGKHKGLSIEEIIYEDPTYLEWAIDEIDGFVLDAEAQDKLDDALMNHDYEDYYGESACMF